MTTVEATPTVQEMKAATSGRPLVVGDVIPDVQLPDLDGQVRRLAEFRGQPLLIFMWASW